MPARADARHTHPAGIDTVVGGVRAHKPDRSTHLFHYFGDLVAGLGAIDDLEHREAGVAKHLFHGRPEALDRRMVRNPTPAH